VHKHLRGTQQNKKFDESLRVFSISHVTWSCKRSVERDLVDQYACGCLLNLQNSFFRLNSILYRKILTFKVDFPKKKSNFNPSPKSSSKFIFIFHVNFK
jgi:hypothetical protein